MIDFLLQTLSPDEYKMMKTAFDNEQMLMLPKEEGMLCVHYVTKESDVVLEKRGFYTLLRRD